MVKVVGKVRVEVAVNTGDSHSLKISNSSGVMRITGFKNNEAVTKLDDLIKFYSYSVGAKSHVVRALSLVKAELGVMNG